MSTMSKEKAFTFPLGRRAEEEGGTPLWDVLHMDAFHPTSMTQMGVPIDPKHSPPTSGTGPSEPFSPPA